MDQHTPSPADRSGFAVVVLAGGRGVRLGGADKAAVETDGRTLLEHAIEACVDATEVVVVGDPVPTSRPVTFCRENPRYGGPAAALLTGRDALVRPPVLLGVLAVDMPRVSPGTFRRLREAAAGRAGAFLTDATGRRQLAGVLETSRLDAVRPDHEGQHGLPMHRLLDGLDVVDLAPEADEGRDLDTWADLRDLAEGPSCRSHHYGEARPCGDRPGEQHSECEPPRLDR